MGRSRLHQEPGELQQWVTLNDDLRAEASTERVPPEFWMRAIRVFSLGTAHGCAGGWRRRPRRGICRHVCRGFHPPSHGMELCPSGHFALRVRFAKAAGATVIATSSSDEKLARLKDLGADHLITHAGNSSSGIPSHATISCGENGSRAANRSRYSSAPGIAVGSWLTPAPARPAAPLPRVQTILSD